MDKKHWNLKLLFLIFLFIGAQTQAQSQNSVFIGYRLEKVLLQHFNEYQKFKADEQQNHFDADDEKATRAINRFISEHPDARINDCRIRFRGRFEYHFEGRQSEIEEETKKRVMTLGDEVNPENIIIFAGKASPVLHEQAESEPDSDESIEDFEGFKKKWRQNNRLLHDLGLEIVSARVALLHFKQWGVSPETLEDFLVNELKIKSDKIKWLAKNRIPRSPNFFDVKNKPAEDPYVDLNLSFSALDFSCSHLAIYRVQVVGLPPPQSEKFMEAESISDEIPEYTQSKLLGPVFEGMLQLTHDERIVELRQRIEDQTACRMTIDFKVIKDFPSLNVFLKGVSSSVGLSSRALLQGWNEVTHERILKEYKIDFFEWKDLSPQECATEESGGYGFSKVERYQAVLEEIERATKGRLCDRVSEDWIQQ